MSEPKRIRTMLVLTASLFAALCCLLLWTTSERMDRLLVASLEQRFRRTDVSSPESLTGIIVLSGDAKRFSEAGRLARIYSNLKIVVSDKTDMSGALAEDPRRSAALSCCYGRTSGFPTHYGARALHGCAIFL